AVCGRLLAGVGAGGVVAEPRPPARVPGRLDQQAANVAVADLGDRALAALLTGGVLRGHEADEGHELLGAREAAEVADLSDERERGQRVDAAQTTQPRHQLPPRALLSRLPDRLLERLDAAVDAVDGV